MNIQVTALFMAMLALVIISCKYLFAYFAPFLRFIHGWSRGRAGTVTTRPRTINFRCCHITALQDHDAFITDGTKARYTLVSAFLATSLRTVFSGVELAFDCKPCITNRAFTRTFGYSPRLFSPSQNRASLGAIYSFGCNRGFDWKYLVASRASELTDCFRRIVYSPMFIAKAGAVFYSFEAGCGIFFPATMAHSEDKRLAVGSITAFNRAVCSFFSCGCECSIARWADVAEQHNKNPFDLGLRQSIGGERVSRPVGQPFMRRLYPSVIIP